MLKCEERVSVRRNRLQGESLYALGEEEQCLGLVVVALGEADVCELTESEGERAI